LLNRQTLERYRSLVVFRTWWELLGVWLRTKTNSPRFLL
jgi:hypothetical protein